MEVIKKKDGTYQHGATLILDESPQTCTFEDGKALYLTAARVLESISAKLFTCKPPPMLLPSIDDICRKDYAVEGPRIPYEYSMEFVISNINILAGQLQWVANPDREDIDPEVNKGIFFLNCDLQHSFSHWLPNIRYNVIVMTYLWALDVAGCIDEELCNVPDVYWFWKSFIEAWVASLKPDSTFHKQKVFLDVWESSNLDLILFRHKNTEKIKIYLAQLKEKMPKVPFEDARKFIELCDSGSITMDELKQVGPTYALHFVLANIQEATEFDNYMAHIARERAEEKAQLVEKARVDQAIRRASADDHGMDVDDDDDFKDVHFPEDDDEDEDMGEASPALDVSRVDWDDEVLRGLLNVHPSTDISVKLVKEQRPRTSRQPWITEEKAMEIIWTKTDMVSDLLDRLTL
ncbi:uncharacterized protein N0V89_008969 [Didymosphaeria variabile]|uniref:Uncharacterized protein n=1 Tax=Didymosphaeria variabile TaxID=1932322 RepID=A0A9W9C9B8_9PLEO|nr:uncharacterized protein N0V89_008969 [Didymosphaeria variabile]KAJ4350348.1 hypothetical protein N0V89_008969 [Didymosphaeria variabile]